MPMKFSEDIHSCRRLLLAATLAATLMLRSHAKAQTDAAEEGAGKSWAVLPLEKSASRGIVTRDPSDVVQCKGEYWVFYTGRGIPSYHSKDLVTWERGPRVFKTAPKW